MNKAQADHKFSAAVGAEIRRLREVEEATIGTMAKSVGVSISTWHQWERVGPKLCWLPLIAAALPASTILGIIDHAIYGNQRGVRCEMKTSESAG